MSTMTLTGMMTATVTSSVTGEYNLGGNAFLNITSVGSQVGTINGNSPPDITWAQKNATASAVTVDNAGIILATGSNSRVFDTTSIATAGEAASSFNLSNTGTIIAGGDVMRDQFVNGGGSIAISNSGTIEAGTTLKSGTVNGRDFNFQQDLPVTLSNGSVVSSFSLLTINNTGIMLAADDAIRVTNQTPGANSFSGYYNPVFTGNIKVSNTGTIMSEGYIAAGTASNGSGSGQAIDFGDVNGIYGHVVITNGAAGGSKALIEATDSDAIRPGNHGIVLNYGTIIGGQVFTTANESLSTYQAKSDGVYAGEFETINVTNFAGGFIEGAKSGVYGERDPATETLATDPAPGAPSISSDIIVYNLGTIIGEDGKGVGADYGSIYNAGTIIGEDNPALQRGDGDGIDVNFTVNVTNAAGGVIDALGSEGRDDNGRINVPDGLAIGGGTVVNAGTIYSETNGITVNNDSNPDGSRSGNADLVLLNTGTIDAEYGYAIRSENKGGTDESSNLSTVDYDTVTNYGLIESTDNSIPNFNGTFYAYATSVVNGTIVVNTNSLVADPHVIGTLDGTIYTTAQAGSIRFTEGDGSAIQLGEGNDILNNYGTIYSYDGLAINLEGGNNTLNLFTGSKITGVIDGGIGGTNILNLGSYSGTTDTLAEVIDFANLNDNAGTWTVSDSETYSSIAIAAGADLIIGKNGGSLTGTFSLANQGNIDLAGLSFSGTTGGMIGANGLLHVTEGAATETFTFTTVMAGDFVSFSSDSAGGTDLALCFYPGTRIGTPTGEIPVEELQEGELVETVNGPLPIRWIGQSHIATRFADPIRVLPIRIQAGALGEGLPARDLLLSPNHAIYIDGILIQAGALINGDTVIRERDVPAQFTYYHIELATHELLYAEGAPAESFVDNVDRMHFRNWDDRRAPREPIAEMDYPVARAARQVPRAIRNRLSRNRAA